MVVGGGVVEVGSPGFNFFGPHAEMKNKISKTLKNFKMVFIIAPNG